MCRDLACWVLSFSDGSEPLSPNFNLPCGGLGAAELLTNA